MALVDLGIFQQHWEDAYDSSLPYTFNAVTKFQGKIWCMTDTAGAAVGEAPGTSSKWELMIDSNALSFGSDVILYTDSNGDLQELPLTPGYLNYDGNDLEFVGLNPAPTVPSVVKFEDNDRSKNLGFAMITSTDDLVTAGYYTTTVLHNSPAAVNNPTYKVRDAPGRTAPWAGVASTYTNMWAWTTSGQLFAMGNNAYGELGVGDVVKRYGLVDTGLTNVVKVIASGTYATANTAFAITSTGKVYATGYNGYGQCATGDTVTQTSWVEITGFGGKAIDIATTDHIYAYLFVITNEATNNLYGVGRGSYGVWGNGTTTQYTSLTPLNKSVKKALAKGFYSSYSSSTILLKDGTVESTGYGSYGNLGIGDTSSPTTWTQIAGGFSGFTDISFMDCYAGSGYAINANKELYCWGYNGYGQLGSGNTTQQNIPFKPVGAFQGKVVKVFNTVTYNGGIAIVLTDDGKAWFSGYSGNYQSGLGTTANVLTFTEVPLDIPGASIIDIRISGNTTSTTVKYLLDTGDVYVVGYNAHGQAGIGLIGSVLSLTKIIL